MRRAARRAMTGFAVAVAIATTALLPGVGAAAPGEPPLLTTVSFRPLATPSPVLGADGRMHLAYELQVVNQSGLYVTLSEVRAVRAGGANATLSTLRGPALAARMNVFGGGTPAAPTLRPGGAALIFMDATYARGAAAPGAILHRIRTVRAAKPGGPPPPGVARTARFTGVRVAVDRRPAVIVQPPLRGPRWVVGNGCCNALNAHRGATLAIDGTTHVAERFAIDFVQLDAQRRMFSGPIAALSSYAFFGETVYSAAPGRVVGIKDGQQEQTPGSLPEGQTVETAGGNYVVVDIGSGRYAFYAHLQPGSLRVKVGDRVAAGQPLGLLGNTGNTDAPHLHFHVMDGPSPLTSNGLPFRLSAFTGEGVVTSEAALASGEVTPVAPRLLGARTNALPLNLQLVDFGG